MVIAFLSMRTKSIAKKLVVKKNEGFENLSLKELPATLFFGKTAR
jgi:hypothetical protein